MGAHPLGYGPLKVETKELTTSMLFFFYFHKMEPDM